ncbi:MAG TPA: hypothetical protein VMZ28_07285 [Kofleriaceae bacterium]|nr:hypothetical protein [Kofleriaceae bacterium]
MHRLISGLAAAVLLAWSGTAAADPCTAGADAERAGKLPLAHLLLGRCAAGTGAAADAARPVLARVARRLADGDFAPVAFSVQPAGAELRVAGPLEGQVVTDPFEIWLPLGTHHYTASAAGHDPVEGDVVVDGRARQLIQLRLRPTPRAGGDATVDFGDDGPAVDSPIVQPDPRPKKHRSLIPKRWLGTNPSAGVVFDAGGTRRAAPPRPASRPRRPALPWTLTWGL